MTYDQATNPRLLHMNNDVYRKNIIGNLHFVCVCLYLPAIKRKLMQHCITTLNVSECVFNIIHNICIIKLLSDYIIQVFVCVCRVGKVSVSYLIMYSLRLYSLVNLVFCTLHSDFNFSRPICHLLAKLNGKYYHILNIKNLFIINS